jgi:phage-related minor tail protein
MNPANQLIGLAETLGGAFSESFKGLVTGSMTAQQALANLFQRTADHFLDMAAQMIAAQIKMQILGIGLNFFAPGVPSGFSPSSPDIGGTFGVTPKTAGLDFSGAFSGRALGGAVGAGRPYMVGERGPELFVPGAQGNIVPNNAMGGANVTVNVDASGSSVEGNADQASQLGKAIGIAVQQELVKQKRPGGLLAS